MDIGKSTALERQTPLHSELTCLDRIPGGSEDVMLDLMIRQLAKNYQRKTKELERPRGSSRL